MSGSERRLVRLVISCLGDRHKVSSKKGVMAKVENVGNVLHEHPNN